MKKREIEIPESMRIAQQEYVAQFNGTDGEILHRDSGLSPQAHDVHIGGPKMGWFTGEDGSLCDWWQLTQARRAEFEAKWAT